MKITAKITAGLLLVSLLGFGFFARYAQQTGVQMMTKLSIAQNQMYSSLISSYLEHSMTEHATQDSLEHLVEVFDRVFGMNGEDLYGSSLFLLDTAGQVSINLTENKNFRAVKPEELALIRSAGSSYKLVHLDEFDSEFSILHLENRPACTNCHGTSSKSRGYIGVSIQKEEFLSFADGHSAENMVWMAIIILFITGSIMLVTYFVVILPIKHLEDQIRITSRTIEDTSDTWESLEELKVKSHSDEISSLGHNFNFMLQRLNSSRQKLKLAHEESLLRADRLVSTAEMAASLAHEIKNPLAGVMGALEVIHQKTDQENEFKYTLAEVNRQLFRINHTLDDLLVFARPSKPNFTSIDVNQVIQATLTMLQAQPTSEAIEFSFKSNQEEQLIHGDSKQISQVFWNILSNAIQAMTGGGTLSVEVEQLNDHIQVTARDSGVGISKEDMQSIFNSFFTTKSKGTGLGLSVTKQILDTHHARIEIESEPGLGTTVTLSFLRAD